MAIKASEIEDVVSFEQWLEGQSENANYVIASRSALRVLPIALSINQVNHRKLTENAKSNLILQCFRASYISWVARKYPTYGFNASAGDTFVASGAADELDGTAFAAATRASAVASQIGLANFRTALVVSDSAYAASTAFEEKVSDITDFANFSAYPSFSEVGIYAYASADGQWLEKHPDAIDALINQQLWDAPDDANVSYDELRCWLLDKFNDFRGSDLAQDTSFGLIADWYAALLPEHGKPRSLFGEKKDIELAMQPKEFWEGEAQEVMDLVAELVGWRENYRNQDYLYEDTLNEGEALVLEEDKENFKGERAKSEKFSKAKAEKVSSNRMAVRFQLTAILNSIAIEKEFIGEQPNEEEKQEDWLKKKEFLDEISELANKALNLLPIEPDGTQNEKDDEVASLLSDYAQEFDQALRNKKSEVVDWVINLGSAAGLIGLVSLAGGFMPIATPIILRLTCGDKVMDVLRVFKSSLPKKKPKDKDE